MGSTGVKSPQTAGLGCVQRAQGVPLLGHPCFCIYRIDRAIFAKCRLRSLNRTLNKNPHTHMTARIRRMRLTHVHIATTASQKSSYVRVDSGLSGPYWCTVRTHANGAPDIVKELGRLTRACLTNVVDLSRWYVRAGVR